MSGAAHALTYRLRQIADCLQVAELHRFIELNTGHVIDVASDETHLRGIESPVVQ